MTTRQLLADRHSIYADSVDELLVHVPAGFKLVRAAGDKWFWSFGGEASIGVDSAYEAVGKFLVWWLRSTSQGGVIG
jgi:hypothetical protein